MSFKKIFTVLVFMLFASLAGYELMTNIQHTAKQDVTSVRYVRSMEQTNIQVDKKTLDVNKTLGATNAIK